MSPYFIQFIAHYGYLAMFGIIILQELGVPIPMFNEVFLMFFGYLAFEHVVSLPLVILVTFMASFGGAWILYGVFYSFMPKLLHHLAHQSRFFEKVVGGLNNLIESISKKVSKRGAFWGVFIGRIVPFGRGYICITAGAINIKPRVFLEATVISDTLWNAGLVLLGFFLGPNWEEASKRVGGIEHLALILLGIFIAFVLLESLYKKLKQQPRSA